jgi:hypothetical protein
MAKPDSNEISIKMVYGLVLGFIIVLIVGSFTIWGAIIGAIIIIGAGLFAYISQPTAGSASRLGMPALHRELAKTHCGQCGAPMRSNMMFCPVCGAKQTVT